MKKMLLILLSFSFCVTVSADLKRDAEQALERGVKFFHSISTEGGYVWYVTSDLSERWGEGIADESTIEVQAPGTPAVGMAFLRAYNVTQYNPAMRATKDAADALIRGQNSLGGWDHTINFSKAPSRVVSFDDDQTQSTISFLMAADFKFGGEGFWGAIEKSLNLMTTSQLSNGGWPHKFPRQFNYHDYATFNDEGMNDCIRVMIEADGYYSNDQIGISLNRAARFIMMSQLPPPQPGWAQQYNEFNQPAWARSFEPPSLCPLATVNNLNSLMDLAVVFKKSEYLEPIHDSLRWLDDCQLPNGLWPRFIEIGTGKPLYYDRGRIRVDSPEELSEERRTGYGYETDLTEKIAKTRARFERLNFKGWDFDKEEPADPMQRITELEPKVKAIVEAQDKKGRWITIDDRFKKKIKDQTWNGEWEVKDRISSRVFINNVNTLCEFLELLKTI
ncbi:MAG: hypothetical protein O3C43_12640 [Verrucomicrobia bacterium]|nr:hypothetical protein [Verrucomicrobiota bacterium]MDA1067341.1 hypothetical protein [Verrucomicrobiota bacterium]